jgi:hypothetical protein
VIARATADAHRRGSAAEVGNLDEGLASQEKPADVSAVAAKRRRPM